jgi:hypothetical protein
MALAAVSEEHCSPHETYSKAPWVICDRASAILNDLFCCETVWNRETMASVV